MLARAEESVLLDPHMAVRTPSMVLMGPTALQALDAPLSTDNDPLPYRKALLGPFELGVIDSSAALHDHVVTLKDQGHDLFGWQQGPARWRPAPRQQLAPRIGWFDGLKSGG